MILAHPALASLVTSLAHPRRSRANTPRPGTLYATFVREPAALAACPLIRMADRSANARRAPITQIPSLATAPVRYVEDENRVVRWQLLAPDWCITSPPLPPPGTREASLEAVMDVYVTLLALRARRGPAADTEGVTFEPAALMREMRWTDEANNKNPSGEQYRQLKASLQYLCDVKIDSAVALTHSERVSGHPIEFASFSVLASWDSSRRSEVGGATRIRVRFTPRFAALLTECSGPAAEYGLHEFFSIPRGMPRALFRHIQALRAIHGDATIEIPAEDVLMRLGCGRRDMVLSRMQQILRAPHTILAAGGHLPGLPIWKRSGGHWSIRYDLGAPPTLTHLLEQSLEALTVSTSDSRSWVTDTDRAIELVTAAVRGTLTPAASLLRMFRYYFARPHEQIDPARLPHFVHGKGITVPTPRCDDFWIAKRLHDQARAWLDSRRVIEEVLRDRFSRARRPELIEGLVLLAAHRLLTEDARAR